MLSKKEERYLNKIWTTTKHPAAYTGPYKLYQIVKAEGKHKIGLRRIKQFLSDTDAYSLQKRVQRKFVRRHMITDSIDSIWDGDLQDVKNISKDNDGIQYILVLQDIYSRYLFTAPLKQKSATEVISGLKGIFATGRKPKILRTDKGSEFKNKWVKAFLKRENVHPLYTENETKSSLAERSIQKLENKLHRMFVQKQTHRFIDELANITKSINATPTRPLGSMAPAEVTKETEEEARYNAYVVRNKRDIKQNTKKRSLKSEIKKRKKSYKFKINDKVRISHLRRTFQREYDQKWTGEIFLITHRYRLQGIDIYKLKDYADESISGTFYERELQKVNKKEDTIWKIDKIIRERTKGGIKEVLVSWYQWPAKFNSWIKKSEIVDA